MDKSDLELFKQALNEGVSNKFDKMAAECTEEIVYSEKHKLAMRAIVHGKTKNTRVWSPKMKRIIAILIAAALLLTGCGIIFRNEIREIFKDFFVSLTYEGDESAERINDVYILSYVPDGYILEKEKITPIRVQYEFTNNNGDILCFEQRAITSSDFIVDSESGYSRIVEIKEHEVYHRFTDKYHHYIWNSEKYSITIKSSTQLSNEEIVSMIDGVAIK